MRPLIAALVMMAATAWGQADYMEEGFKQVHTEIDRMNHTATLIAKAAEERNAYIDRLETALINHASPAYYGISNITESVSIVTNVTATDNAWECQKCKPVELGDLFGGAGITTLEYHDMFTCQGSYPATEKTTTTVVKEVTTLRFYWRGQPVIAKKERELSRDVKRLVKKEEWVEE